MDRRVALGLGLWLTACGGTSEAVWMRGFGLRWNIANHRLSQAAVLPTADGVQAAFIGGGSTTGCVFVAGQGCVAQIPPDDECLDAGSCAELVFFDRSLVAVDRIVAEASGNTVLGTGSTQLTVGPDGASGSLLIELPYGAGGDAVAWIRGLALTTDVPKPSDSASCYDPRHGWLPNRIRVSVGEPTREGGKTWLVPVEATFSSGLSFEAIRSCLDAVVDEAAVAMRVDVAMALNGDARVETITQSGEWARGDDQTLATIGDRAADVGPVSGWRTVDWTMHEVVEPGRGAYLRSLAAWVDPTEGQAWGVTTNDSPTQLSGFDMAFEGELVVLDGVTLASEGVWGLDGMETTLDASGAAVLQELESPVEVPTFTE